MYTEAQNNPRANGGTYAGPSLGNAVTSVANGRVSIPQALDEQTSSISNLHQVISDLEKRLALILAMDSISPATQGQGTPTPDSSQVLDRVGQHTRAINIAASRISEVLQRLHL